MQHHDRIAPRGDASTHRNHHHGSRHRRHQQHHAKRCQGQGARQRRQARDKYAMRFCDGAGHGFRYLIANQHRVRRQIGQAQFNHARQRQPRDIAKPRAQQFRHAGWVNFSGFAHRGQGAQRFQRRFHARGGRVRDLHRDRRIGALLPALRELADRRLPRHRTSGK